MKIFHIKNIVKILGGIPIIFVAIIVYASRDSLSQFWQSPEALIWWLIFAVCLFYYTLLLSYKMEISDNSLKETQWLFSPREINFQDIAIIKPSIFNPYGTFVRSVAIENNKYKGFPRQPVSEKIVNEIRARYPSVNVDLFYKV